MKKIKTRKRVLVLIDSFFISHFCRPNTLEIFSPIPHDAKHVGINYDPTRDCFFVCFEHKTFKSIPLGDQLPIIDSIKCQHIVKEKYLTPSLS